MKEVVRTRLRASAVALRARVTLRGAAVLRPGAALSAAVTLGTALLAGCAGQADHFYTLDVVDPAAGPPSRVPPSVHVLLDLTVPSVVDRSEMVVNTAASGIVIADHQRWAAPLADEMSGALARDIEALRPDVIVADRRFDQSTTSRLKIVVAIVEATVQRSGRASIEAHWRISDGTGAPDRIGTGTFDAPVSSADYSSIARAYSQCLGELAAKLVEDSRR